MKDSERNEEVRETQRMWDEKIKAAIFDADGTLLDSMPVWNDIGELYLKSIGLTDREGLGETLHTMSLEQGAAYLKETYDLNQTRYREGDITGMEMSQFQTQLSNKKITYTQALINYRIELLNLKILSLYDFDKNIPIVPMKDIIDKK